MKLEREVFEGFRLVIGGVGKFGWIVIRNEGIEGCKED